MHRAREFLERCLPHSEAHARESTWTKLIQIHEQKYRHGRQKGSSLFKHLHV